MTEWYFQPTKSKQYSKLGGIGHQRWFGTRVPIIEGIFISSDTKIPSERNLIPISEIRWIMEESRMLMIHQTRLGSIFGYFSILQTPDDFETAKRITGFKPYHS
ncbi:MAG: hypothetical protein CVV32_12695 [Methanomicrobiales archaeon HGW-Methanomicrobiales-3]|jgi:hypothetical protein|nr:MAG: hypothetical protein CVV32_12695 [Methanomicrobiales archaeon HGW-Methanomicrobiales-3]